MMRSEFDLTRAARELEAAGLEITRDALAERSGLSISTIQRTIKFLKPRRLFHWNVVDRTRDNGAKPVAQMAALEAAAAIIGRGERLTYEVLAAEMGCSLPVAHDRVQSTKRSGRWPHEVEKVHASRKSRKSPPPAPALDKVTARHRREAVEHARLLEVAASIADEDGCLKLNELARAMGMRYENLRNRVNLLRSRRLWPYHPARQKTRESFQRADPELQAALTLEDTARMRDGRGEIDDIPGVGCWSGKAHLHRRRRLTPAQACRRMLAEWRSITSTRAQ